MKLQRQQFLLSYFKILSVDSAGVRARCLSYDSSMLNQLRLRWAVKKFYLLAKDPHRSYQLYPWKTGTFFPSRTTQNNREINKVKQSYIFRWPAFWQRYSKSCGNSESFREENCYYWCACLERQLNENLLEWEWQIDILKDWYYIKVPYMDTNSQT